LCFVIILWSVFSFSLFAMRMTLMGISFFTSVNGDSDFSSSSVQEIWDQEKSPREKSCKKKQH
jgi:hypothetical protein